MKKFRLPRKLKKKLKRLNGGKMLSKGDMQLIRRMRFYRLHFCLGRAGRKQLLQKALSKEIMFVNGSKIALSSDRPPIGQLKGDNLYSFWANNGVELFDLPFVHVNSNY